MLRSLLIENFIYIEKAQFSFSAGLNIFTGETGAGKSMIFGALMVGLGGKASSKLLRVGAEKLSVSLVFSDLAAIIHDKITEICGKNDDHLHIKREITQDGKSLCRVNDVVVTLEKLQKIAPFLVDVHSQHQQQYLLDEAAHVLFYDSFCHLKKSREEYLHLYRDWKKKKSALVALREEKQKIAEQKEFLLASAKELEENLISEDEYQLLKNQLIEDGKKAKKLEQLAKIERIVSKNIQPSLTELRDISDDFLQENQDTLLKKFDDLEQNFSEIFQFFQQKIKNIGVLSNLDPVNEKLAKVEKLRRKYLMDIAALQQKKADIQQKISLLGDDEDQEKNLCKEVTILLRQAFEKAMKLHSLREKALQSFEDKVRAEIHFLGMEEASLVVALEPKKIDQRKDWTMQDMESLLSVYGVSKLSFLYSSSAERKPGRLKKIASGGELSRLMLSLKVILNEKIPVFTMLFDEIDTGIGGDVANQVGVKLQQLAQKKQVILVTHLAQIARFADSHFFIYRDTDREKSVVKSKNLQGQAIVKEIARMLGEQDSEVGQQLALQMLNKAHQQKK